ncbi:MAG: choloylglycine hydrolase [Deltaproteobacteria bacterium HGW-Deltaproteobacteria-1]|jgi:choloylglycine hydrolase|nr:MAG: choloylglycine hydrolase [Deltaproteobacteria bacterium HGW-Deltaproteobacteria-1]
MVLLKIKMLLLAAFISVSLAYSFADACTGLAFSVRDAGSSRYAVQARTMEFGADVTGWRLISVPKGYPYKACKMNTCGDGITGLQWTAKYQHVGMSPARPGLPVLDEVADGINEKGLSCGGFYHMGYEEYHNKPEGGRTIANTDFVSWVLSNFATVREVREALEKRTVDVAQFTLKYKGKLLCNKETCPQLHYLVTDESGASIVIEFKGGKAKIFDSVGVITNNPTYDWHITNMKNYIGLQSLSRENAVFNGKSYDKMGNGTGAVGLPGDFTAPSRFVRAMFFLSTAIPTAKTGPDEAIERAFRILNQFDIPEGSIIANSPTGKGQIQDSTAWTSLSDLKRKRYYFHTQTSRAVRMIELDKQPKQALSFQELPAHEMIIDISEKFTPVSKSN